MNESDKTIYAELKVAMHSTAGQLRENFERGLLHKGLIAQAERESHFSEK